MNYNADFKEWLNKVRFSRNVCMLIPMESCMGYPIVVKRGKEFVIPFFKVTSTEKIDTLSPPFAYLRISFPSASILTYNNLRTLPEWKDIDWNINVEHEKSNKIASKLDNYYSTISSHEDLHMSSDHQDDLLLDCISQQSEDSNITHLVTWYKKLFNEAKKYR